jgi:hypothetical protein
MPHYTIVLSGRDTLGLIVSSAIVGGLIWGFLCHG